jgi:hypothetical protein
MLLLQRMAGKRAAAAAYWLIDEGQLQAVHGGRSWPGLSGSLRRGDRQQRADSVEKLGVRATLVNSAEHPPAKGLF